MKTTRDKDIEKLQENLYVIRRLAGWSAEDLGERIGVTKQTIRNLEKKNNDAKMSKTQYIAIRAVLDYELAENPDNVALKQAIEILLDSEDLSDDEKERVHVAVTAASGVAASGVSSKETAEIMLSLLQGTIPLIATGGSWIARILSKTK